MQPLVQIHIYKPDGSYYVHGNSDSTYFPVTDSCERKAEVMGENSIHLMFALEDSIRIKAFSYVTYDAVNYFVKEDYEPQYKDGTFNYDLTFYAIENLLDKILIKKSGYITQQTKNLQRCSNLTEIQEKITENAAKFYSVGASVFANFQMPKYYLDESTGILYKIEDFPTNPLTDLPVRDFYYSSLGSMLNEDDRAALNASLEAANETIYDRIAYGCQQNYLEGHALGNTHTPTVSAVRSLTVSLNFREENYYGTYSYSRTITSEVTNRVVYPFERATDVKLIQLETNYQTYSGSGGGTHWYLFVDYSYKNNHYTVLNHRGNWGSQYSTPDISTVKVDGSSILNYISDMSQAVGKTLQVNGTSLMTVKTASYREDGQYAYAKTIHSDITLGLNILNLGQYSRYIEETTFSLTSAVDNFYVLILESMARGRFSGTIESDIQRICATSNGLIRQGVPYDNTGQNIAMQFDGTTIKQALDTIAEELGVEWYIYNYVLFIRKCTRGQTPIEFCDAMIKTGERTERRRSGGLLSITPKDKESGIPAIIYPVGSERNIVSSFVHENAINQLIQYDNRLHLRQNYQYTVKDDEGHDVVLQTNSGCGIASTEITTHIEQQIEFNEIYPRCYYRVKAVITDHLTNGTDRYKIVVAAIKADGTLYTTAQMKSYGLFLTKNTADAIAGQTPTIIFENGLLNGFEFEVNFGTTSSAGTGYAAGDMQITIVTKNADENADTSESERDYDNLGITVNSTLLPQGDFIPQVGDEISIIGIYMPNYYVEMARQELAQAAYDRFVELTKSLPAFTCVADPKYMKNKDIYLGSAVRILAQTFNNRFSLSDVLLYENLFNTSDFYTYLRTLYESEISSGTAKYYWGLMRVNKFRAIPDTELSRGVELIYKASNYYRTWQPDPSWAFLYARAPHVPQTIKKRIPISKSGTYTLSFIADTDLQLKAVKENAFGEYCRLDVEIVTAERIDNIYKYGRFDHFEYVPTETKVVPVEFKREDADTAGLYTEPEYHVKLEFSPEDRNRYIYPYHNGQRQFASGDSPGSTHSFAIKQGLTFTKMINTASNPIDTIENLDEYMRSSVDDPNPEKRYLIWDCQVSGYTALYYFGEVKRVVRTCDMIAYVQKGSGPNQVGVNTLSVKQKGNLYEITFEVDSLYVGQTMEAELVIEFVHPIDNSEDDLYLRLSDITCVEGEQRAKWTPPQSVLEYKETRVVALKHPLSHPEQVTFETASIKKLGYLEQQKIQMQQIKNQIKKK